MKHVDALLEGAVNAKAVPGLVAMAATNDGVVYRGAFGHRELGQPAPMTLDTVVWLASMSKPITATAAMQLVERGTLELDRPAAEVRPELGHVHVLTGFDDNGRPRLRPPRRPITLRQLLTHTSGYAYEGFSARLARYSRLMDVPTIMTCQNAALMTPLVFEPGEGWQYGIGVDWAGKMIETASGQRLDRYLAEHVLGPLGMTDTAFKLSAALRERLATAHQRAEDGSLTPVTFEIPQAPEFHMGGGGLYGTASDYLAFTRMFVNGGAPVLKPSTVALMAENHIGSLDVPSMESTALGISKHIDFFPGMTKKWGISFLINTEITPTGRSAGSLSWSGVANTYFWIDRARGVSGVFLSQVLPFFDDAVVDVFTRFETEIYRAL